MVEMVTSPGTVRFALAQHYYREAGNETLSLEHFEMLCCGSIVIKALWYKPEGHGFKSR
jgi:hypothetical protein